MNTLQRQSTAKYFYDISKGVALVAVVGGLAQQEWILPRIISGIVGTLLFFIVAYLLEGRKEVKNE